MLYLKHLEDDIGMISVNAFMKEITLEHLRGLRHDWSNEIPDEIVHSDASNSRFKVRACWFIGVTADVINALEEGEIRSRQGKVAAEQLIARFTSEEWAAQELTRKVDIQEANRLIDIILGKQ